MEQKQITLEEFNTRVRPGDLVGYQIAINDEMTVYDCVVLDVQEEKLILQGVYNPAMNIITSNPEDITYYGSIERYGIDHENNGNSENE